MEGLEGFCHVRGHAQGKFAVSTRGDPQYKDAVEDAAGGAIGDVVVQFNKEKFESMLKEKGIPEERIKEFMANLFIDDETYFVRKEYPANEL